MKNKRLPIESLMAVLDTTRWLHKSTHILNEAKIDRRKPYGQKYLRILVDHEMLRKERTTNVRFKYYITEKGLKLLEDYKDLLNIFKELMKE